MSTRDNGLQASAYSVLVELEASLGDRMLEALAARSIAAYVVPVAGPGGAARLILHVDAAQRVPAGIVLAGLTPALAGELPGDSEAPGDTSPASQGGGAAGPTPGAPLADDDVFAELVASFHRTPTVRTWPAAEDLPDFPPPMPPSATSSRIPGGVDRRRPASPRPPAAGRPEADTRRPGAGSNFDGPEFHEEEHYEPPTLPKLTPHSPVVRWALLALTVGLALLLVPTLFAFEHRTTLDVVGVLCVLGGTAALVSRLRDRSPDDPQDGAVV